MHQGYELLFHARRVGFARSLDEMNPEIAELEALHRATLVPAGRPARPSHRRLAGVALALGLLALTIIGTRWGAA